MKWAVIFIVGAAAGWLGMNLGFSQWWWPMSISGDPEMVITGKLVSSSTFTDRFEIQSGSGNILVYLGEMPEDRRGIISGKQAMVRGPVSDNNELMTASWFWILP